MGTALGIDIGGTFIDVVIADGETVRMVKVPSTPSAPARGVIEALAVLRDAADLDAADVRRVVHGSTVATNALLEGGWAKAALVTTRGFRDVLEIGRQDRPSLYDLTGRRAPAVIPRDLRFEIAERVDAAGQPIERPAEGELAALVGALRDSGVAAVAVVFLFSYLYPNHERIVGDTLARELGIPVACSSEVLPEFREYERSMTTAISAALQPVVGEYLSELEAASVGLGLPTRWQIMQSSGTVASAERAQRHPARILLSGPAGGVKGARVIGDLIGETNLITMDMGGTSCDVSLIHNGSIGWTREGAVGGYPVALPMVEIHTIGAGGGSIAWIDPGGALRVGPQSAGSDPGPVCYGHGGQRATVTDAHLVLGHLPAEQSLGGLPRLDAVEARRAVEAIATGLSMSVESAALGILEVADAAMERAIRVISVERGHDPREFALLAFGGAGPLHAVSIARRLAIPRVIIPPVAGVLSAYGLLAAESGHDFSRSIVRSLSLLAPEDVAAVVGEMAREGLVTLRAEGVEESEIRLRASADLRYLGQSHEVNVDLPVDTASPEHTIVCLSTLRRAFDASHEARFGHSAADEDVELVTVRVRASGPAVARSLDGIDGDGSSSADVCGPVWFNATGPVETPSVHRERLRDGRPVVGPMIVVSGDATLVIPPETTGRIDESGIVTLEVG